MDWSFVEKPKSGTETALEACDYFLDEVIEITKTLGESHIHISEHTFSFLFG